MTKNTTDETESEGGSSDSITDQSGERLPQTSENSAGRTEQLEVDRGRGQERDETTLAYNDSSTEPRYEAMPAIRPVLIVLGSVLGAGLVGIGVIASSPTLFGGPEIAEILVSAIAILVAVIGLRLASKAMVLSRTQYAIYDDTFRREYELFYRSQSREIPVEKLRGHEYSQGRIQSLLGIGSVRLLTAGTNRSLGFIEFEHLDDPERVREEIRAVSTHEEFE
ncbi:PH domain-containing protein [Natronorubrum sp. JWXQ-INN-674]|uniref:PH domain-containing protein n=1 Tax=Natronorubrum halalkaliphilum TaxID=2691917 RepID=A0A6B0VPW7_9EURY|nr:PH domain-containing protein [Natronorubrum halalkaliphilum]MXV63680.1 PH domain-containing protein [Natronorubrum halalkaliphilum]